ncbi:LAQU0S11e00914g1_1 [Lachancea quebecensis]|uniref:LAQU0S11e00914g1_1 n=1 Tax=Lachancea quebecensis TaxID=1654605 RepID=A0A0P1KUG8_9SACH|nr:LAQU0S11e00914g1_1 [Lachancea quebecensis]
MDFHIPPWLPEEASTRLRELIKDYHDGDVTAKGYLKKRQEILDKHNPTAYPLGSPTSAQTRGSIHIRNHSLASTIKSQRSSVAQSNDNYSIDTTPMLNSRNNSIYKVTTRNSSVLNSKTNTLASPVKSLGDDTPGSCYKPMIPLLPRTESPPMTDSLPSILRARSQLYERETAFMSINNKNKETGISWDRLYLRAEKVAHELAKHKLYKMDKVLLWFNKEDLVEFTVSLLGCFIAGMVAVPVSLETYSLSEISQIVGLTNAGFTLIAENCLKQIDSLQFDGNNKVRLTKSGFLSDITFITTDDLGTYSKAKKNNPTFDIPSVSYIEFTRTPLGRLSGVVMKHKILSKQLETMAGILNSRRKAHWSKGDIERSYRNKRTGSRYTMLSSLDPTRSTGLIFGVLFNIYTGNLLMTVDDRLLQKTGMYENIINKHRVNILLNDQLQLKQVVINYLENPALVTSKRNKIDFSCINWCITSCTNIDTEVTDMIVHKWLKNLGCLDASQCYSPMLTLLDFGGIFISMRDQLGNLGNFPVHDTKLRLQDELFIDKELLKDNIIKPSITAMINSSSSTKDYLRLSCFGFPIPDATVCIVNPDDGTLVPDLTVGELWISSPSITDEFYQMEKINEFVFNAKLNFKKMTELWQWTASGVDAGSLKSSYERLDTIMSVCPPSKSFIRTKLMGFVHNGKIYVLALIEDMFLQNKLVRLPNWSHTSDVTRARNADQSQITDVSDNQDSLLSKRVVQTYYLQHITENVVRMVEKALEVSVFELPQNKNEHFLVMVVETPLASNISATTAQPTLALTTQRREQCEKKMTAMVEQIYKILWIFHRIQPMCVILVTPRSLPRRYCSLEIANSTVEKKFLSGSLNSKFVKFQLDNVILDFIPHSSYVNESIFSEHLSSLRHSAISQENAMLSETSGALPWQTSGIDYREKCMDNRNNKDLTTFSSIIDILEWRSAKQSDEFAFSDGIAGSSMANASPNNVHSKVSWKTFNSIVGNFVKKIVQSKTPLKSGEHVVILSDNSVEYVATVIACFYCNLVVIPIAPLNEADPNEEVNFLISVVNNHNVKRIFVDAKMYAMLEDGTSISRQIKRYKHLLPKITVFSKIKKKNEIAPSSFKDILKNRRGPQAGESSPCVIWIDRETDIHQETNVVTTHKVLLNMCKIVKETLQLTSDNPVISMYKHTAGLGFIQTCLIGIYMGKTSCFFNYQDILGDATSFLISLQNFSVKDLILSPDMFCLILDRANSIIEKGRAVGSGKKDSKLAKTMLRPDFLRKVQNIMIPFQGRPLNHTIEACLNKYPSISVDTSQLNYVYQHIFNPLVALKPFDVPSLDIYLDLTSLREGLIREINPNGPNSSELNQYLHLQGCGIVAVCTDVSIVNPETLEPCFENEIGEIWCCSEANVYDYWISKVTSPGKQTRSTGRKSNLQKIPFISAQFKSKLGGQADNGLSYLRTGDLGFIKKLRCTDSRDNTLELAVLYVLGSINETVEILGLTHFVSDLEATVKGAHPCITNCMVAKVGGLLSCLVECRSSRGYEHSNLTPLIVAALLKKNGVVLDLCCFVKPKSAGISRNAWQCNRMTLLKHWLKGRLQIEAQFGINYGENNSIYLLSDFAERK